MRERLFVAVARRATGTDWSGTTLALDGGTLDASSLFAERTVTARML